MSNDPKKYFRVEARDLVDGLSADLMAVDRGEPKDGNTARLFRFAHTLKGAAMVVGEDQVAEIARLLEDILGAHREAGTELTSQEARELLALVSSIESELAGLAPTKKDAATPGVEPPAEAAIAIDTVRIDLDELDSLTHPLTAAEMHAAGLAWCLEELDTLLRSMRGPVAPAAEGDFGPQLLRVRHAMRSRLDALGADLKLSRQRTEQLRLVRADSILPILERTASTAAATVGNEVRLELKGGDVRLDRSVLQGVREAFLHLIRNAVDHGIEPAATRRRAGKPAEGRILLSVIRRGNRVAFRCEDDGAGIDADVVRKSAVKRGIVNEAEASALDAEAVLRLLFRHGMSTRCRVTELSGRGVGLDVVQTIAVRLRGRVQIETRPGQGTEVELLVPVSLSTIMALEVHDRGITALIPSDSVAVVREVRESEVRRSATATHLVHDSKAIPYARLGSVLPSTPEGSAPKLAVVIRTPEGEVATGVDTVAGLRELVVRPLPWGAGHPKVVHGVAVDVDGAPRLVLDPARIFEAIRMAGRAGQQRPDTKPEVRKPLLVIDDSLTTRMLEQSILEAAGYQVDVAVSGEDGLRMARQKSYGLYVVDVEMPGMSGFDFTSLTRSDPELKNTPVVLVTSLSAPADKQRGREAGASAYVVKGEFHQGTFLRMISELSS